MISELLEITPPQKKVMQYGLLESGFNCLLQMPTGSGKTWLAEQAIASIVKSKGRAIYISPIRALALEVFERWTQKFSNWKIGVFTGDFGKPGSPYPVSFAEAQILIMTPERLDACTRYWRSHWHWIPEVDLLVVDEFHLLGDGRRGAKLEGTINRFRRLNPFTRILSLSATLGNREELADWLGAVEFISDWRPVPLTWKICRYRKAQEKPDLLYAEVLRNVQQGGKSLVFVQSRRRAETLAKHLTLNGLVACHHHAGLCHKERQQTEKAFRSDSINVMVATSTLEMGLNLPVRQVVLYDLQEFKGTDYQPLSVNTVWQRVGRAGRPGLDKEGEALLIIPTWDSQCPKYEKGEFEPTKSHLANQKYLAEQILAEISSGLARNCSELISNFSHTLAAHQNRLPDLAKVVQSMLEAGMLKENETPSSYLSELRLKPTALGYIAARHMLTPASVTFAQQTLNNNLQNKTYSLFDYLLIATATEDCELILPVIFEEIEELGLFLSKQRSLILNNPVSHILSFLETTEKSLLKIIKTSAVIFFWTQTGNADDAAEQFNCYPFEIFRLQESMTRLLPAMAAIADVIKNKNNQNIFNNESPHPAEKIRALERMVITGLDESAVTLSLVSGIGQSWAKKLSATGYTDIEDLAQAEPDDLVRIGGISVKRAKNWITEAEQIMRTHTAFRYQDDAPYIDMEINKIESNIDSYRLRRALELIVKHQGKNLFRVTGGLDPHTVKGNCNLMVCDCQDFAKGHTCKHILAVKKTLGDPTVQKAITYLEQPKDDSTLDLYNLWYSSEKRK